MAFYQNNNPFTKKSNEEFEVTEGGDNSKILNKYGWSGKQEKKLKVISLVALIS